ncbi:MAG TPA: HAD hydrolase family protein [Gemmatimonadaceae bacterium]|nr:HAD hydrolase family protein [Gemmatimonadaceae bacterium]
MTLDRALAQRIRLVGLDVDGVLTDGGLYIGDAGGTPVELKRYDIQDGLGVHFLRAAGIRVVIFTGRESESVRIRGEEMECDAIVQDRNARKLPAFLEMLDELAIAPGECAFIGDDFPDMGVLRIVGLPVAVANAVPEVRAACLLQLERSGGCGAVREFAEGLLRARGEWNTVAEQYVAERSAVEGEVGA